MAGVIGIQLTALVRFDDGYQLSIASPFFKKDIRHGDIFSEELTQETILSAGEALSNMLDAKTLKDLHGMAIGRVYDQLDIRRPKPNDPFSVN